ncbi:fumarylacetoacetate hydrolase family protein [Methylocystis parvus]|uniref:Fumarylacetoacetate hydrolase family protein n=1 Tax=Methylocystis parvus TaxID=134 RepID=A0A6B8M659_9HYPH|nr:fumarylacetoacetate hydrolase family protein [Methylocystis parvus]QGM97835.1 fumarylacetoacetate hydrolase family protein [Methylocystis parvus]WBK01856.1 fumarylacetoacetate hydrolase family protein [Methylocystis parvus OBBP]
MKLASLKSDRDGRLAVVSRDLTRAALAAEMAPTLQAALDDWENASPRLAALAEQVEAETTTTFRFRERDCAAPLPRAFQWADGSAYVNHVALVRKARGAEIPGSFWTQPLMYQGGSDAFLGPRDAIPFLDESFGLDVEGEIVVITGDTPMGVSPEEARAHIKLVMLVNDVTLRGLVPDELARGFGFFQSKPSSAFSPIAATPDEFGAAWQGAKLSLPLLVSINGAPLGRAEAGVDMTFDFGQLIAHAARTRRLSAGTIIGSGTVSNRAADGGPGLPVSKGGVGYSCIVEQRMVETLRDGAPATPYLRPGDVVRIEMVDRSRRSIFGAIEQRVEAL